MSWLQRVLKRPRVSDAPADPAIAVERDMDAAFEAAARGDYKTAIALWRPLANDGVARAQSNLGACYAEGLGLPRDSVEAARWFSRAADAGDAVAQRNLATLHFKGEGGVPQDDAKALELFRLAAEQGDAAAQDMVSWMLLERGDGDPVEARRWALAAAEQGVAASMTRLGLMAHNALGVERDPAEAARWWREAAMMGEPDGQAMLGAALHLGAGVAKNDEQALVWLLRGEAAGSLLATPFLGPVRAALSPEAGRAAQAEAGRPLGQEVPA